MLPSWQEVLPGVGLLVGLLVVYPIPTIVAKIRKKRNIKAIFILNLFLGWTFLGWVVALVWAFIVDKE